MFDKEDKDALADLAAPTLKGELSASLKYTISNYKKERRDNCIGMVTLALIIIFSCGCYLVFENATGIFYLGAVKILGDMDVLIYSA